MSEIQDQSSSSAVPVLQPNNTVTLTVPILPMKNKRKLTVHDFIPPLRKKKIQLVPMEKITPNVDNNNSQDLKNSCSTSGCTCPNTDVAEGDRAKEDIKIKKEPSSNSCQTESCQLLSILDISNNAKAIKFYTGFKDYEQFLRVFETLGPEKYDLRYFDEEQPVNLSHLDQFLVALILLKQHKSHYEISIMFNITLKDIKNIFITWIRFMKMEWNHIKIKKVQKSKKHGKIAILNNNSGSNIKVFESSDQDYLQIIDLENDSEPDKYNLTECLKKVYKILLNGPANYIELHLVKDIKFVCERLFYFASKL